MELTRTLNRFQKYKRIAGTALNEISTLNLDEALTNERPVKFRVNCSDVIPFIGQLRHNSAILDLASGHYGDLLSASEVDYHEKGFTISLYLDRKSNKDDSFKGKLNELGYNLSKEE
ncbi:MAG: hypothetical protein AABW50_04500 [Nanoarchaeota archaeon]